MTGARITAGLFALLTAVVASALGPTELAISYQDSALRVEVAQRRLTSDEADARLRVFARSLPATVTPTQIHEQRLALDRAASAWFDDIERQVEVSTTWPGGQSAADRRPLALAKLHRLRAEMSEILVADTSPAPLLQQAANIAAWTRGVEFAANDFAGHEARLQAALQGDRVSTGGPGSRQPDPPSPPRDGNGIPPEVLEEFRRHIGADGDTSVTFRSSEDAAGSQTEEETGSDQLGIRVISATWGANCPGVRAGNVTAALAAECDRFLSGCEYLVDTATLPDPAPGCVDKTYVAEWLCGDHPTPRRAEAQPRPDLGSGKLMVQIECED